MLSITQIFQELHNKHATAAKYQWVHVIQPVKIHENYNYKINKLYSSTGTSSSHNNENGDEVGVQDPPMCNLPIKI